jgi:hypothetical protein
MNPAGKFAAKARIVELPSVGTRDERRQALVLRQFLSERYVDAFRCRGRLETRDDRAPQLMMSSRSNGSIFARLRVRSAQTSSSSPLTMNRQG